METLAHTALSVIHRSLVGADAAIVSNAANAPLLPSVKGRGIPVATHVGGFEWRRPSGARCAGANTGWPRRLAVRSSDLLIADAQGIADNYRGEFSASIELIAYGAPSLERVGHERNGEFGVGPGGDHPVVAASSRRNMCCRSSRAKPLRGRPAVLVVGAAHHDVIFNLEVVWGGGPVLHHPWRRAT